MSPAPLQREHCSERLTVMFVVNPLIASSNERLSGISMSAPRCGCGRGGSFSLVAPPPNRSAKMSRKLLPPPPPGTRRAAPVKPSEIKTWRRATAGWTSTSRVRVRKVFRVLTKAIVDASLLRIGEHVVRFRHEFEAFLGSFVTRIYVRVILPRQSPVSLLDLIGLGVALDAEYFVIVLLSHLVIADCQLPIADLKTSLAQHCRLTKSPV